MNLPLFLDILESKFSEFLAQEEPVRVEVDRALNIEPGSSFLSRATA